jgi:hypothetical protein
MSRPAGLVSRAPRGLRHEAIDVGGSQPSRIRCDSPLTAALAVSPLKPPTLTRSHAHALSALASIGHSGLCALGGRSLFEDRGAR